MGPFDASLSIDHLRTTKRHGTACITCRRRKRSCDKRLPCCQACVRHGLYCEGYVLRWACHTTENASELRTQRPLLPKTRSVMQNVSDIPAAELDSRAAIALLDDSTREYDIGPESFPDGLGHLVNYGKIWWWRFVGDIADWAEDARQLGPTFFQARDPQENPYFLDIIQSARNVAPIRFALASSASFHLASTANSPHLIIQSFQLRGNATRLLRERLRANNPQDKAGSLSAMLVLAQLDVGAPTLRCSGLLT
jgi:hypothetical protein